MKKNVLRKDFIIEIKKTMGRFVSIFFIVALGVAFYSGIRASEPSMRITADQYFDDSELMDLKVWDLPKRISKRLEKYRELKL